ncbi:hypothetical protein F4780DRAFT_776871 [Xylariomycetidae sp. FL0641]|nr:hypothetical protein F4780DRAFT_776871 [Xylariomycetidae sp. FL0641]
MPAIMDDPSSPTIHRVSGPAPYPDPDKPELPASIQPRRVLLRDRQTIATVVPFVSRDQVPPSLLAYLADVFAQEIEGGDTYPMIEPMPPEPFSRYWFQNFAAIMLLGQIDRADDVVDDDGGGRDWARECLGSFYIKPNYPGRSSHVCNAGFLVTSARRNRGVGRLLGECYLDWAPRLGYSYSVFNLVYETNVASCRIWDALGFRRIGRVRGCGALKSYPDRLVDAIIYGRELGVVDEQQQRRQDQDGTGGGGTATEQPPLLLVSDERFDKIKFYLKHGRYPNGSNRAEKSRLRSAATHYKLVAATDVLMLKDKEVVGDPGRQFALARATHEAGGLHQGINKTTAVIAEKFHWSRIKETVSDVIRTCDQCSRDNGQPGGSRMTSSSSSSLLQQQNQNQNQNQSSFHHLTATTTTTRRFPHVHAAAGLSPPVSDLSPSRIDVAGAAETAQAGGGARMLDLTHAAGPELSSPPSMLETPNPYAHASDMASLMNPAVTFTHPEHPDPAPAHLPPTPEPPSHHHDHHHHHHQQPLFHDHDSVAAATLASLHHGGGGGGGVDMYHPIDPQIISQASSHPHPPPTASHQPAAAFESFHPRHQHHDDDLEALLLRTSADPGLAAHGTTTATTTAATAEEEEEEEERVEGAAAAAAVVVGDRDLDMLIAGSSSPAGSGMGMDLVLDGAGDEEEEGEGTVGGGGGSGNAGGAAAGGKRSSIYDVVFDVSG